MVSSKRLVRLALSSGLPVDVVYRKIYREMPKRFATSKGKRDASPASRKFKSASK